MFGITSHASVSVMYAAMELQDSSHPILYVEAIGFVFTDVHFAIISSVLDVSVSLVGHPFQPLKCLDGLSMDCLSFGRHPWGGMTPMVHGSRILVLYTKLHAEAMVMQC